MTMTTQHPDPAIDEEIDSPKDFDQARVDVGPIAAAVTDPPTRWRRRRTRIGVLAFGILPATAMTLALCAGYAKWRNDTIRDSEVASVQSMHAATDGAVAILAYQPDTVERELNAARSRLTGDFLDSYSALINNIVIPGSKQRKISAVATVPAAGIVSVDNKRAVVLVFVDQTTTIGNDPPINSASSVRVTLDKVDNRWLISGFDPV